jgi:hypothetical protein
VTRKPSGPTGQMEMEKGPTLCVTRKLSGPKGRMEKVPQVTHKLSDPMGWMEMEKAPIGTHDTQAVGSHRGPTGQMEKGLIGTRWMERKDQAETVMVKKDQVETMVTNCQCHG